MTLPKFLLAWTDFNWLWFFAKLRPAKDARWSFTRVLLLTAMKAAGGALVGLALSLLLLRQPVGWLPWLLGLFAGCGGLCWFSVTAICWNQRAAQLRANPALPTGLPKSRFRFGRWCLGAIYMTVLGVITPFALLVTVENIRGEIAWKREHAKLVAAGEKLTFREILGPEIPAAQNAGAAAVFAPFFDYHREKPKVIRNEEGQDIYNTGTVWPQSNALFRTELVFHYLASTLNSRPSQTRVDLTPKVDLTEWSEAYREFAAKSQTNPDPMLGTLEPATDPMSSVNVLASQRPSLSVLGEMATAAALPRSQFPIHYDEAFAAMLRHLSIMKAAQQALQRRCAAHLALANTNEAFADATNALNVAELLREEPLLISQLVRYAQGTIAVSTLWQGLAEHRWSDAQLAAFQQRLEQIDYLPGLVMAFEGERAGGILGMEQFINNPPSRAAFLGKQQQFASLMSAMAQGLMRQNQVVLAEYHTRNLRPFRADLEKVPSGGLLAAIDEQRTDDLAMEQFRVYSPYRAIAAMLAPALSKAINKTARAQTTVQLAIVACALERYRLAHREYPEKLEQLPPQFITSVPLDPMVNQPFHYSRTDDGWFLLYSVGLNGQDDGGVMRTDDKKEKEDKDWPWPVPTRPEKVRLF